MNDVAFMRSFQRFRDLPCNRQRFIEGSWPLREAVGERWSLHQFHDKCADAVGLLQPIDLRDVRVIHRREGLGVALEPSQSVGIMREGVGQDLDCDLMIEVRVGGAYTSPTPPAPIGALTS